MNSTSGSPVLLSIRGLEAQYEAPGGVVRAVDDVALDVHEGQRVGIVGESGSGKTQTFFSVFGLAHGRPGVVAGSAILAGDDLLDGLDAFVRRASDSTVLGKDGSGWNRHQSPKLKRVMGRDVAMMFQDPRRSLIPYWTVGRHISEVAQRNEARGTPAADLLAKLGFADPARILAAFPGQLSGGEAQRAMLALTMAMQPRLLVADEPTTGLDALNQLRVLRHLDEAQRESRMALVLISHDLGVVEGMVDYLYVYFGGRVMEEGPTAALLNAGLSSHPYTAALRDSQRRRAEGRPIQAGGHVVHLPPSRTGCPFVSRCLFRRELPVALQHRCMSEAPALAPVSNGRRVACWGLTQ